MDSWKPKLKMRLPAFVLLLATVLFWSFYDRYEPDGPVLLESPALADGTNIRGDVSESKSHFILRVPKEGKRARIDFPLAGGADYETIRASARIKVDGVVVGQKPWHCARVLLAQYDANNKWISGPHGLVGEQGSKDWEGHRDEFEIQPNAARVVVILQQSGTEGTAEFDRIEVQPVRIRTSFVWWRIAFAAAWIWMAFLYVPRCRLNHRKLKILILLNALAILAGAMMPGDWIADGSEWAKKTWTEWTDAAPEKTDLKTGGKPAVKSDRDLQQMDRFNELVGGAHGGGHFILFTSLCFLVYCSAALERQHSSYFFKVGFDVLLFAAVTESLQFLTIDRTAGASDLRIDLYGMGAALLLFLMVLPLIRRFASKPG